MPGVAALLTRPVGGVGGFTALLSRTGLSGLSNLGAPQTVFTSQTVTCTPNGGTPPYTYLWQQTGTTSDMYAQSPTSATTAFAYYFTSNNVISQLWECEVTDSLGAVVTSSNTVFASLTCRSGYSEIEP